MFLLETAQGLTDEKEKTIDNHNGACYNGDSSREPATIGDTMTISILIQGAEVVAISF